MSIWNERFAQALFTQGARGGALGLAILAALGLYASRNWVIYHDAPLMFFVAQRMLDGAVPYRDIVDMNMPGAYLLSAALLSVFGVSDLAWRLLDIGVLLGIAACFVALLRPAGWIIAATSATAVVFYHLRAGTAGAGQRDFLMILPMLAAALLLVHAIELTPGWRRRLCQAAVGCLVGVAATLKPTALLLPPLSVLLLLLERTPPARVVEDTVWTGFGLGAVLGAVALWLTVRGGLDDFIHLQTAFVLPSYARIREGFIPPLGTLFLLTALAGLPMMARSRHRRRYLMLVALIGFGLANYHGQGKGWPYHSEPLAMVAIGASFLSLAMLMDELRVANPISAPFAILLVQAMVLALVLETMNVRPWLHGKVTQRSLDPFVSVLQEDLRELGDAAKVIQPLDIVQGVLNAMLRLGTAVPSKQIYSFPLYLEPRTAFLDDLRADLLARLGEAGYPTIVWTNQQWPYGNGYDRLEAWPAFRATIEAHYALAVERTFPNKKGYRIYVARRS